MFACKKAGILQSTIRNARMNTSEAINFDPDFLPKIQKVRQEFASAERLAKRVEEFRDEAAIPAINELRYAGYHLSIFLDQLAQGTTPDGEELSAAERHCMRASYEAGEAGILAALAEIDVFKQDYRMVPITGVVPHWLTILRDCQHARDTVLAADRENGSARSIDHQMYEGMFDKLSGHCKDLELAREELNKKLKLSRNRWRLALLAVLTGGAGVIMTIFT